MYFHSDFKWKSEFSSLEDGRVGKGSGAQIEQGKSYEKHSQNDMQAVQET